MNYGRQLEKVADNVRHLLRRADLLMGARDWPLLC